MSFGNSAKIYLDICNCRLLGTPTEKQWPGVTTLRDWHVYPQWEPQNLARAVPSLGPDGVDLLSVSICSLVDISVSMVNKYTWEDDLAWIFPFLSITVLFNRPIIIVIRLHKKSWRQAKQMMQGWNCAIRMDSLLIQAFSLLCIICLDSWLNAWIAILYIEVKALKIQLLANGNYRIKSEVELWQMRPRIGTMGCVDGYTNDVHVESYYFLECLSFRRAQSRMSVANIGCFLANNSMNLMEWYISLLFSTFWTLNCYCWLMQKMLQFDPAERISAKAALDHPYFDSLDKSQFW